jgi:hypothetical protein
MLISWSMVGNCEKKINIWKMLECVGNSTDAFVTVLMPNMLPVTTVVMHLQWHMYTNKYTLHWGVKFENQV